MQPILIPNVIRDCDCARPHCWHSVHKRDAFRVTSRSRTQRTILFVSCLSMWASVLLLDIHLQGRLDKWDRILIRRIFRDDTRDASRSSSLSCVCHIVIWYKDPYVALHCFALWFQCNWQLDGLILSEVSWDVWETLGDIWTGCSLYANYNPPISHTFNVFLDPITCQRVSWCHWTLRLQLTYLHSCTLHRSTQMKGGLHWFLLQESDEHPTRRPCTLTWETPSRGWASRGRYRPLMRTSLMQPADRKLWYEICMTLVFTSNSPWLVTDMHIKGGFKHNKWNIADMRVIAWFKRTWVISCCSTTQSTS